MAESYIQGPADGAGKKIHTSQQTVGANAVEEQYMRLSPQGGPDSVQFIGTATNRATNEWTSLQSYVLPVGYYGQPLSFMSLSATAAYGARAIYLRKLGTYNLGTSTWTDAGVTASAGSFFASLMGVVTTALSAAATTVTATYTNESGTGGRLATLALASAQPLGSRLDFTLATRTDAFGVAGKPDAGVFDVTAVTDNSAATGIMDIYGYDTIAYTRLLTANAPILTQLDPHLFGIRAGDILSVESNSYGTAVAAIVQERQLLFQATPV